MVGLVLWVAALVLLVGMWLVGDQELKAKLILTAVVVGLFVLGFLDPTGGWIVISVLFVWCVIVGYWTFGSIKK
jgi:hypothetical protein